MSTATEHTDRTAPADPYADPGWPADILLRALANQILDAMTKQRQYNRSVSTGDADATADEFYDSVDRLWELVHGPVKKRLQRLEEVES